MKWLLLMMMICSSILYAEHTIELDSRIVRGELLPVIKINDREVMMIEDRGDVARFFSPFDRAETIVMMLRRLDQKGLDLKQIRLRRIKSDYYAELKGHRIFTVYPVDRISNNQSSYELAKSWLSAINEAVDTSIVSSAADVQPVSLAGDLEPVNKKGFRYSFLGIFQLLGLILVQVLSALGILWYIDRYRLRPYHGLTMQVQDLKSRLSLLETQSTKPIKKTGITRPDLRGIGS